MSMDVVGRVATALCSSECGQCRVYGRGTRLQSTATCCFCPPPAPDAENSSSVGRAVVMSRVQRIVGGVLVRVLAAA